MHPLAPTQLHNTHTRTLAKKTGEYGPGLTISRKGVGFGSSSRYSNPGHATPGPNEYAPQRSKAVDKSNAAYTFGVKTKPGELMC